MCDYGRWLGAEGPNLCLFLFSGCFDVVLLANVSTFYMWAQGPSFLNGNMEKVANCR